MIRTIIAVAMLAALIVGGLFVFGVGQGWAAQPCHGQVGTASWYSYGTRTANGEHFNPDGMTAAMIGVPFGTRYRVTDTATGRSVVVRINDTGGFRRLGRLIDLSRGAATVLGIIRRGTARVCLSRLG